MNLASGNKKWRNIWLFHCDVDQYSLSSLGAAPFGPLDPEVDGTTIFRNVGGILPQDKMLNHRNLEQST